MTARLLFFCIYLRFLELGSFIVAGNPPKLDKAAILLSDAARLLTQLRNEAKNLKESNETFQEKIKELKVHLISICVVYVVIDCNNFTY